MDQWRHPPITTATIMGAIEDAIMINVTWLVTLAARYVWLVNEGPRAFPRIGLLPYIWGHVAHVWLFTLFSLVLFYLSGIYTSRRWYQGDYKLSIVAQAVTLTYLFLSFTAMVIPGLADIRGGTLLCAWLLTLLFLVGVRARHSVLSVAARVTALLPPVAATPAAPRVLVIGGAGYIGSALVPRLLEKGYRVRLLDLLLFGREPIANVIEHPNLELVQADFRHVDEVVRAMNDVDAVIHLGAIVGDPACAYDTELTIEVNLMATRMIAEVAKGAGVRRFVFASTCSVYGASDETLDETSSLNPVSLYARSKIACEQVLMQLADARFQPTILRFGTIYGFSGRIRFDLVVNLLAAKAVVDGQITVFGGNRWRPFVHVDDAARAVALVLDAAPAVVANQVFNVGSDEQNYTIQQVGEIVHSLVPAAELVSTESDADPRNYRVSFSKLRNLLGFVPHWTIEQGIRQAIENGTVTDYHDARYNNFKFLSTGSSSLIVQNSRHWTEELIQETVPEEALPIAA